MARKRDYGVLLDKFSKDKGRSKTEVKPVRRRGQRYEINPAIRLPSLARLLEIDRQATADAIAAQQAVAASRLPATAFQPFDMAAESDGTVSAGEWQLDEIVR